MQRRNLAWLASVSISLLIFTGCAVAPTPLPSPAIDSEIPQEFASYYTQSVEWRSCGGERTYCGIVQVPVDWSNNDGEYLKLSVVYRQADNAKPLGSMIFNPGGPGTSGTSWVRESVSDLATANLRANYNIVGFDPRGVGESEPRVTCLDAQQTDEMLYSPQKHEINSPQDIADTKAQVKKFADACLANTGKNIQYIDTVSTAKDMDVLRAIFGDSKINYLGYSYGTYLGATYAALFPQRVGRMVLDGAINPLASSSEQDLSQLKGFSQALDNFLAECLDQSDCPVHGTVAEAEEQIAALLRSIETTPLKTDHAKRDLTIWGAVTGLVMPLYGKDWWPTLSQALAEAQNGDGTTLLALADTYNDRNDDGTYASNTLEANFAISCLDAREPADEASIKKQNNRVLKASKVFGRYWLNGALGCANWPFPVATQPTSYAAQGSQPIVVVGTTGDPATPYSQAVELANVVLANAVLITYNGEGHTAYGRENACVNNAVDDYFIKNVVPTEDPECR